MKKTDPGIIETYKKSRLEKTSTDGFIVPLMSYARSSFRDFESCLRLVVGLDEDDIQLILKQYNSNFVTYELSRGIDTIEDTSEAVYTMGDFKGTRQIEINDVNMKTKPNLPRFGSTFGTLKFDDKSFFKKLLGFSDF